MGQTKPPVATTHESAVTTAISAVRSVFTDPASLRYYSDRDIKPSDIQAYIDALTKWDTLLASANAKMVR